MPRYLLAFLSVVLAAPLAVVAQELPQREELRAGTGAREVRYVVQKPAAFDATTFVPLVVLFAGGPGLDAANAIVASHGTAIARRGFVVVSPALAEDGVDLRPLFLDLRRTFRIEQGGLHAAVGGEPRLAIAAVLAQRAEFQTFTAFGAAANADLAAVKRLPARRVRTLATDAASALAAQLQNLHAERSRGSAAGEVARTLDDFHDAAAVGDEKRYFAIFPDDAVFLGTDATERWGGAEFRAFAMPYFQRDSAWTYVTLQRSVEVEFGGQFAWFDELFDNEAYGECRGSGVMTKRGGRWVLCQYHLTIPVPNDLAPGIAAHIRAFQDGVPAPATTVVVVRHGEKVDASADAELSDTGRARAERLAQALRDVPFAAVYTSQFRRTASTVGPLCVAKGLTPRVVEAARGKALATKMTKEHLGEQVLICGHSNTVPEILKALGVHEAVTIADDEYDRLFVVTIGIEGAKLTALRY